MLMLGLKGVGEFLETVAILYLPWLSNVLYTLEVKIELINTMQHLLFHLFHHSRALNIIMDRFQVKCYYALFSLTYCRLMHTLLKIIAKDNTRAY